MRLLLAEDERELSDALCAILTHSHYSVDAVYNGKDALDYLLYGEYDGAVLDIMMPGMDGVAVLRAAREAGVTLPVLFLTAKSEVDDRVAGLDSGADDYLTKPFAAKELLARIRAMTRRQPDITLPVLRCGGLTLDRASFTLTGPGGSLVLANKEFQMLEMLMQHPGHRVTAEQFSEKIWGYDSDTDTSVVWVYISYLRKKLAALGAGAEIRLVRGLGYTLEETK